MTRSVVIGGSIFGVVLVAFLLFLISRSGARAQAVPAQQKEGAPHEPTIVAFGDSLTQGHVLSEKEAYPARLEQRLRSEGRAVMVINAGINGETSSGALSRVKWILNLKPDIVILETGANDGFRGIKPVVIESNIDEIVLSLKKQGVTVVLAGMQMLSNMGEEYTRAFKAVYPSVSQKHDVILIPFILEGVAGDPALNFPDGVHPTAEGHRLVADHVYPYVMEAIRRKGLQTQ